MLSQLLFFALVLQSDILFAADKPSIDITFDSIACVGSRGSMEDTCYTTIFDHYTVCTLFDGHGYDARIKDNGLLAAYTAAYGDSEHHIPALHQIIKDILTEQPDMDPETLFTHAFISMDKHLLTFLPKDCNIGTTASVALLDHSKKTLHLAWVGDSRIVILDKEGKIIFATTNHYPHDTLEKARIEKRIDGAMQQEKICIVISSQNCHRQRRDNIFNLLEW